MSGFERNEGYNMTLKAAKLSIFFQFFLLVIVQGTMAYASPLCTTSLQRSRSGKDLFKTSEFATYKAKDGEIGLQLSDNFLKSTEVVRGKSNDDGYVKLSGKRFSSNGKKVSLVDVYSFDDRWAVIRHGERGNGYVAVIDGKKVTCKEYTPHIAEELEEYLSSKYSRVDEKTAVLTPASALSEKLFGSLSNPQAS